MATSTPYLPVLFWKSTLCTKPYPQPFLSFVLRKGLAKSLNCPTWTQPCALSASASQGSRVTSVHHRAWLDLFLWPPRKRPLVTLWVGGLWQGRRVPFQKEERRTGHVTLSALWMMTHIWEGRRTLLNKIKSHSDKVIAWGSTVFAALRSIKAKVQVSAIGSLTLSSFSLNKESRSQTQSLGLLYEIKFSIPLFCDVVNSPVISYLWQVTLLIHYSLMAFFLNILFNMKKWVNLK